MNKNPLLQKTVLPKFDRILPRHFKPAIITAIKENRSRVKKLLAQKKLAWDSFILPLEEANEKLIFIWSIISHLNLVTGTKQIRKAYETCLPLITKYSAELSQNVKIYKAFDYIYNNKEHDLLNPSQKKILSDGLRDFFLAGVALSDKEKQRFTQLKQRLAKLSNKFSYNV